MNYDMKYWIIFYDLKIIIMIDDFLKVNIINHYY